MRGLIFINLRKFCYKAAVNLEFLLKIMFKGTL